MSATKSLWGELPLGEVMRTPAVILREQAIQLTEQTGGLLRGNVHSAKVDNVDTPLRDRLSIIVPALENYNYTVLDCFHDIMLYPISVVDRVNETYYQCSDEIQLIEAVERILSSSTVHKAIKALISQSRAADDDLPF